MKVALVNPPWNFEGSIYFGCREPHLPLEFGYTRALLQRQGHDVLLVDAHLFGETAEWTAAEVAAFAPDMTVVTTAPSYLFWRCPPPELRTPRIMLDLIGSRGGLRVVVGPHGSSTPATVLRKLEADVVVRGECEEVVTALADADDHREVPSIAFRDGPEIRLNGAPAAAVFTNLLPLRWGDEWVHRHRHHHHRFDREPDVPGAEVEASRGCPYACTFCAKIDFRDKYRKRDLAVLLDEIDGLLAQGVGYLYFIDEIFLPNAPLLEALCGRHVSFGVQTRIDLWKPDMLALLGRAGCVSIEAGVESLTEKGRNDLAKKCRLTTDELTALLVAARGSVPFVQANLIATADDDAAAVAEWRDNLRRHGVWANDPVPLYPYPSSPDYRRLFGLPDEHAWERAHSHYLAEHTRFSDIQDNRPVPLRELEAACA